MGLLKISTPDFGARNLRRDGQNGDAAALAIVKAVDQMHISGPAASGAYSQFASEMRLCARRERRCLLIARANPSDLVAGANRIRDAIERIAWDAVNSLDARSQQDVYQQVSHSLGHFYSFLKSLSVLRSSTTYARDARTPLPHRRGARSDNSSSLQTGRTSLPSPAHACSILMSCGTFSTSS
jgi:hypothetical protein